jgi:hypothetical protein
VVSPKLFHLEVEDHVHKVSSKSAITTFQLCRSEESSCRPCQLWKRTPCNEYRHNTGEHCPTNFSFAVVVFFILRSGPIPTNTIPTATFPYQAPPIPPGPLNANQLGVTWCQWRVLVSRLAIFPTKSDEEGALECVHQHEGAARGQTIIMALFQQLESRNICAILPALPCNEAKIQGGQVGTPALWLYCLLEHALAVVPGPGIM